MDTFVIQGGHKLSGTIAIKGSKNAALAILPATILVPAPVILRNVADIGDIRTMLDLLKSMGAVVEKQGSDQYLVDTRDIDPNSLDTKLVGKIRASLLLIGPLAARFGSMRISTPGGCNIGTRPIDAHLTALEELGFEVQREANYIHVAKKNTPPAEIVMSEFSVTATENCILAAVGLQTSLTLKIAAADHMVQDLCWFLNSCGADIQGVGTHTLKISSGKLKKTEYTVMAEPNEAGTFLALAGASNSILEIKNVPIDMLVLELLKFREAGVAFDVINKRLAANGKYEIGDIMTKKGSGLKPFVKLHDMPAPGFLPDVLQPFAVMLTQAHGISLIYDWMYDGRLKYVKELKRMGADMKILDAHRVMVNGPTPLFGKQITSFDLRAGATLVIAALIAEGESVITGVDQIDRGYERLDERLRELGASIERR